MDVMGGAYDGSAPGLGRRTVLVERIDAGGAGPWRGIPCLDPLPAEREEVMEVVDVLAVRPDGHATGDYGPRR
jgi:hypothetical protein